MKRSYLGTLVPAAITACFAVQNRFGFVLALLAPVLLIYFAVGLIALLRRPEERRRRAIRMLAWLAVLVASGFMQTHWFNAARKDGDTVASAVIAFKSRSGSYPQTLADVHIDADRLSDQWWLSYRLVDGKPMLAYTSTALPMDVYEFDFDSRKWLLDSY